MLQFDWHIQITLSKWKFWTQFSRQNFHNLYSAGHETV